MMLQGGSDNLEAVRRLEHPDYERDETALMYLLRYQFSHANLAWSMLAHSDISARIERNGPIPCLQVVDLGAGGFALLLGLTMFLAELLEQKIAPERVRVLSIEPSSAMRRVGDASWRSLLSVASDKTQLSYPEYESVRRAIVKIDHRHSDLGALGELRADRNAIRMLTAMHAISKVPQETEPLRESLEEAHQRLRPHCGFLTAHRAHVSRMHAITPFSSPTQELSPEPKCVNEVELLTLVGDLTGTSRIGRFGHQIDHTYGWWSKPLSDTSVLYWPNDHA